MREHKGPEVRGVPCAALQRRASVSLLGSLQNTPGPPSYPTIFWNESDLEAPDPSLVFWSRPSWSMIRPRMAVNILILQLAMFHKAFTQMEYRWQNHYFSRSRKYSNWYKPGFFSHQVRLGVSVEEEGRQGKALKERQPGLRVHVHWHPSVSRSHSPSFSKEK